MMFAAAFLGLVIGVIFTAVICSSHKERVLREAGAEWGRIFQNFNRQVFEMQGTIAGLSQALAGARSLNDQYRERDEKEVLKKVGRAIARKKPTRNRSKAKRK